MPLINLNCCGKNPCECNKCDSCAEPSPCTTNNGCPILLDSTCVVYNKYGGTNNLYNIDSPNGSTLEHILENINAKFDSLSAVFSPYTAACINFPGYVITTLPQFIEAVDDEFCTIKSDISSVNTSLTTSINNLTNVVDDINNPAITASCTGLVIGTSDTLRQILIKLKDAYCSLYSAIISDQSPTFSPVDTTSISWIVGGPKNHIATASVRKSTQIGNALQILPDGLYVGDLPTSIQTISYNSGTRTLILSGGGGSVTFPADQDQQTLSLNTSTKILSISGGNTVDFTPIIPSFTQTPLNPSDTNSINLTTSGTANTNISADVKISSDSGNIVEIRTDGLFAEIPSLTDDDERVKASSAGAAGYLIDKTEGCVNGPITTGVSYNTITDKLTICSTINTGTLLSEIGSTPALLSALCALVQNCVCFKFRLVNTDTVNAVTYNYTDCNGTTFTGLSIGASGTVDICGTSVTPGAAKLYVFNLGFC